MAAVGAAGHIAVVVGDEVRADAEAAAPREDSHSAFGTVALVDMTDEVAAVVIAATAVEGVTVSDCFLFAACTVMSALAGLQVEAAAVGTPRLALAACYRMAEAVERHSGLAWAVLGSVTVHRHW